jgi:hypothetical protein
MTEKCDRTEDRQVNALGHGLPRYKHEFQRNSGSREMVEDPEGEWVKMEDIRIYLMPFISGYLLEHRQMLKDGRAHPKIIEAVEYLEKQVNEL